MGLASDHFRTGHQSGVILFGLKRALPVAYPDYPLPLNENQRLRMGHRIGTHLPGNLHPGPYPRPIKSPRRSAISSRL